MCILSEKTTHILCSQPFFGVISNKSFRKKELVRGDVGRLQLVSLFFIHIIEEGEFYAWDGNQSKLIVIFPIAFASLCLSLSFLFVSSDDPIWQLERRSTCT